MTIFETIRQRRSIGKMTEQSPTRAQIEQILEAATHAPNHHKTEPWRFVVLAGHAREELGTVMASILDKQLSQQQFEKRDALLDKERQKLLRSPVVIVVASVHAEQDSRITEIEDFASVAAAVQNMLLTAEELGLAAVWRTGEAAYSSTVKEWLGFSGRDHLVAFLYLGYPAIPRTERQPVPATNKTRWLGWID
ncbi:nitroreductase family protein [Tengunoibacter tsumagoiensis]|uniref:Putative NAD(P)H nitroreductase n=1 Tax=Tengunoibacter tsumagoiensis TaxID=2014871 RepID=A0A401ZX68_9CHLR|nr:nitroreductase [Tengunoibacter tsumagoiensis]GCE11440.1 nitroreductase [Tengunoibacter tsumagoiensis]